MLDARLSGCINHPGVEAVIRCKQCGTAVCGACVVATAAGRFCCETCSNKYEAFTRRAQDLEPLRYGPSWMTLIRRGFLKLIVLALVLAGVGYASLHYKIPYLSDMTRDSLKFLGIQG